jgi:GGDEF domain-containing protein
VQLDELLDLDSEELAEYAEEIVPLLEKSRKVRQIGLTLLSRLASKDLAKHGSSITLRLEDSNWMVRQCTLQALSKLEPQELVKYAPSIVAKLDHSDGGVREAALQALGKLESSELAKYAEDIANRLEDTQWRVREVALHAFGKINTAELAKHASVLIPRIAHSDVAVRIVVLQALGKLEVSELAKHVGEIAPRLEDFDGVVRNEAFAALVRLEGKEIIKASAKGGEIYLRHAAKMGVVATCQAMLDLGVDFSKVDVDGKTALDHARQNKHQKIIEMFTKAEEKRAAIAAGLNTSEICGIPNRRQYDEDIAKLPPTSQLCVFSLDMANLKVLNEEKLGGVGHDEADRVLCFYAKELVDAVERAAKQLEKHSLKVTARGAYHMHGDEFCGVLACDMQETLGFQAAAKELAMGIAAIKFVKEGYPETYFRVGALCRQDASYDLADKLQEYCGVQLKREYPSREKAVPLLGRCNWKFSTEGLTAEEKQELNSLAGEKKEPEQPLIDCDSMKQEATDSNAAGSPASAVRSLGKGDPSARALEELRTEVLAQRETIQCQRQEIVAQREVIDAQREVIEALKQRLAEVGWITASNAPGNSNDGFPKMTSMQQAAIETT